MKAGISVALLSAAPPDSVGSMHIYEKLVQQSLAQWAPHLQVSTVHLLNTVPVRPLDRLKAIGAARWRASRVSADVVHLLDSSYGYLIGSGMARATPLSCTLATVHDLIPALQVQGLLIGAPKPHWAAQQLIANSLKLIRRAGAVHAVSEATAKDVKVLCGRKMVRVLANPLRPLPDPPSSHPPSLSKPFVLHIGNQAFYKNRATVVRVFSRLVDVHPHLNLVLAGGAVDDDLSHLIQSLGISRHVHSFIHPDDNVLAWLYHHAELLLFPSLYEGFGWPPLEAMNYGCAVVSSTGGALPEVCGDAALLAPPQDVHALASACLQLISNQTLKLQLITKGYQNLRRFTAQHLASGLEEMYWQLQANRNP